MFWSSQFLDLPFAWPNWEDLNIKSTPQAWYILKVTSQHERYHFSFIWFMKLEHYMQFHFFTNCKYFDVLKKIDPSLLDMGLFYLSFYRNKEARREENGVEKYQISTTLFFWVLYTSSSWFTTLILNGLSASFGDVLACVFHFHNFEAFCLHALHFLQLYQNF